MAVVIPVANYILLSRLISTKYLMHTSDDKDRAIRVDSAEHDNLSWEETES